MGSAVLRHCENPKGLKKKEAKKETFRPSFGETKEENKKETPQNNFLLKNHRRLLRFSKWFAHECGSQKPITTSLS
jgi:hypothetical protein